VTSGSIDGLGAARPRALAQAGSARATRAARAIWARPELLLALGVAAALNLWGLSRNGWANTFYAGAVRSMASSWHNFLFASLDRSGLMTVDKPPLAFWVQALSVRVFGWHSLSILVPQALMGVAAVALTYDLVRRRFGRVAGFAAGLALALTPITVAISRDNNPDQALILCCVAALWFCVRGLEDGRARWIVWSGVCVGLGFEAKMSVALFVVPGIALAWLYAAPVASAWVRARRLLWGGVAMTVVGLAWPLLVTLTPAADRPWISGTSDNSIWSLIVSYNGVGRVTGQAGAPTSVGGGGGGGFSAGATGAFRLLDSALGGQAGWLIGFAIVAGVGLAVLTRLGRRDERTGWLIAVGGAFAVTAVLFSAAGGIFHPYYVSLLAPFTAMMVGAGAAQILGRGLIVRVVGPLAVLAGVTTELVVRSRYPGQLTWLPPVLIAIGVLAAIALAAFALPRVRRVALGVALAALLLAPAVWAVDTLGYATSGTFPSGGPQNVATAGGSGFGGRAGAPGLGAVRAGAVPLFGSGGSSTSAGGAGASASGAPAGVPTGLPGGAGGPGGAVGGVGGAPAGTPPGFANGSGRPGVGAGPDGAGGGQFGGDAALTKVMAYVKQHGGGTIAVSSQSSAAQAIVEKGANVAGIGGFSGRESDVSVSWLAQEVKAGKIRWVLAEEQGGAGPSGGRGLAGDTRAGAKAAIAAVEKSCQAVTLTSSGSSTTEASGASTTGMGTLYDCQGRAGQL
jgi:4-amino-4-deoxy-L-arabinose transferase-like glycosyltransferase